MTDNELWELRLSVIKDVMTLTDKQLEYVLHELRRTQCFTEPHKEG